MANGIFGVPHTSACHGAAATAAGAAQPLVSIIHAASDVASRGPRAARE